MKTLVITSYVETSSKVKVTLLDPYTMENGIFIQYKQYNPHCKDIIAECNRTNIALMPVDTWNRCIVNAKNAGNSGYPKCFNRLLPLLAQ